MSVAESVRFRPGLLADRIVVVAGPEDHGLATASATAVAWGDAELADEASSEAAAADALARHGRLDALVYDGAHAFAQGGLRHTLDTGWLAVRAVAVSAFIPEARGGAVALLAPGPGAGVHAEAARAGLENMARTLSIEWARFGVRPVAITPGAATTSEELGALLVYLLSPAGDYFSGCRLSLGEAIAGS